MQDWIFQRVLRMTSTEARALHGLGPTFHWSQSALGAAVAPVISCSIVYACFKLMTLSAMGGGQMTFNPLLTYAPPIAFVAAIQVQVAYLRELHARRKEQSLLLILPGAPTGREVNGRLMRMLLLRHFTALASAVAFVATVTLAFGQPLDSVLRMSAAPFAGAVIAAPMVLRNYASMRRPWLFGPFLFVAGVFLPLHIAVTIRPVLEPVGVIVVAIGLSAIVSAIRYVRLLDAPAAFPVGRLAN
jgi:hypothetical protein